MTDTENGASGSRIAKVMLKDVLTAIVILIICAVLGIVFFKTGDAAFTYIQNSPNMSLGEPPSQGDKIATGFMLWLLSAASIVVVVLTVKQYWDSVKRRATDD